MDTDQDVIMGDDSKRSLPSHPSLETPLISPTTHQEADPILASSLIPQTAPKSPSSESERFFSQQPKPSEDMAPPLRIKLRLSESAGSTSADNSGGRRDSLIEPNSDWSDEDVAPKPEDPVSKHGLPVGSLATGLCYDARMRYHCEVRQSTEVHPEDPRRIYYIFNELCNAGLVDCPESNRPIASQPLARIPIRNATEAELSTVHTNAHYAFVHSTQWMTTEELIEMEKIRDSIYFNRMTFKSALLSAGGAIETCLAVAQRKVKNAIAVIRPPGHHAEHDTAMGFCLFNNVAVAARVCQEKIGPSCRKILIIDWDVHHGNGIQKAFYDDPNILYISLHVHQDGKFYPGGPEGDWDHCGAGAGLGKNINIPWPDQGMGDGDYLFAFQQVIMPIASEFNPDLVIVASGFDAAAGDVLGGCFVTPACYSHMTHMLMTLANGKLAVCLEGGYNFHSISVSALAVTKTLMGEPPERLRDADPSSAGIATVRRVMNIQGAYWGCMYPKPPSQPFWSTRLHGMPMLPAFDESVKLTNMEDLLREVQSKNLYRTAKLTPLYIYRTSISKSFENQVLASPNYHKAAPLVVMFHDPPELIGIPNPMTNQLDAHNCWIADSVAEYVEFFIGKGYSVIDVNIPKHITQESDTGNYADDDEKRPQATEELAAYLWDNYIEPNDATEIFFMGIGSAFCGVANLLIQRENLYKRVNGCISFVAANPVRAIASATQTWLSKWYRENSLVFVAGSHGIWERKPSKRYGMLRASPKSGLNEMLSEHKEEVFEWISERADEPSQNESDGEAEGEGEGDEEL
ncbi:histone deacetylase hda1 [Penicillium malachiteum]|uniref:histone deacetylase hda1 n=1 Tax=Penicillium malachiteum TaxID=1324776 RepID=UPI0025466244|nr:histone deacetylase hda1 [Penicillium malachiteum]KAJ5737803.1 histone deacetylase hda1 [Penicillium malachiteum]